MRKVWFGILIWPSFLLFWNTNMAAVTSCENPLYEGIHLQFRLFTLARRTCLGRAV